MIKTHFRKYVALLLVLSCSLFSLTGCYNTHNIDKLAYVVAIGLDVSETNNLKLSLQLATPGASSGSDGASSSTQSSSSVVNSIDCSSISSGLLLFNSYISKEINLSHCKVVVISEELAQKGISEYLYTLINNIQISSQANVIICRCPTQEFLNSSEPILEKLAARYYEIAPTSSEYTGFTQNITLGEFFSAYTDTFREPFAILGSINTPNTQQEYNMDSQSTSVEQSNNKDHSYLAGQTPIDSATHIENMGLAVFSGDKIVGELNGLDTISHMIVTNKLKTCDIQIPSPLSENDFIDLRVTLSKKPKIKVELINGSPFIRLDISIKARILSMNQDSKNLDQEKVAKIEAYCNNYLQTNILEYLYDTAKDYHSDIDGFGKYAVKYFKTWEDWINYNWLYNYRNSFFEVNVSSSIKSGYTLMET